MTNESIAYDGIASCLGHNIWVMETGDTANGSCPNGVGQNRFVSSDSNKVRILKSSKHND